MTSAVVCSSLRATDLFLLISTTRKTTFFTHHHVWHFNNYQAIIKLSEAAQRPRHLNNSVEGESCTTLSLVDWTRCHYCIILWLWQAILRKVVIMQRARSHTSDTHTHTCTHTTDTHTQKGPQMRLDSHVQPISLTVKSCGVEKHTQSLFLCSWRSSRRANKIKICLVLFSTRSANTKIHLNKVFCSQKGIFSLNNMDFWTNIIRERGLGACTQIALEPLSLLYMFGKRTNSKSNQNENRAISSTNTTPDFITSANLLHQKNPRAEKQREREKSWSWRAGTTMREHLSASAGF